MNSQASHSQDRFATTRWSMVIQLDRESPLARNALGELVQRYWYPVYAYVRRRDHSPDVARNITRSVLHQLLRDESLLQPNAPVGHYRSFLLERVHAFLAAGATTPPDDADAALTPPADLESRYLRDHAEPSSPDHAFQRSFALVVLHRSLRRLRDEAAQTGHLEMYRALEPYLARDPGSGEYERIAARLRSRQMTLVLALKRLRQRLHELAGEELSDTVSTASDLANEQNALLAVLGELH